jgi:hypothetical protein
MLTMASYASPRYQLARHCQPRFRVPDFWNFGILIRGCTAAVSGACETLHEVAAPVPRFSETPMSDTRKIETPFPVRKLLFFDTQNPSNVAAASTCDSFGVHI